MLRGVASMPSRVENADLSPPPATRVAKTGVPTGEQRIGLARSHRGYRTCFARTPRRACEKSSLAGRLAVCAHKFRISPRRWAFLPSLGSRDDGHPSPPRFSRWRTPVGGRTKRTLTACKSHYPLTSGLRSSFFGLHGSRAANCLQAD